ncbi:MAG: hypothetical protein CMQ43_09065 [Gammaproteobacteria bacterium]|nr:hypothetical protein [Gammaproteobacteria bacterium]|tara:strand:+ start:2233 stop:2640 length:408 start_codon:yes stop_codon:yes gene_type:complete
MIRRLLLSATLIACWTGPVPALADQDADKALLQRIYQMRMRHDQERQQAENEARANVRLATQGGQPGADSPTVTQMRQQTNVQLARFEQRFRCLDVDVDSNGGNTVVICGDNAGDISGSNTSAGRDLLTIDGAGP